MGTWFSAASALPLDGRLSCPLDLAKLMGAAVRRPRRLVVLIGLLLRTPREHVVLSGSRTGQALDAYFNERRLGILKNRLYRGVLILPADHSDYLRGRRRHAVRANLRRAATAGIRCEVMSDSRRAGDEASAVLRQRDSVSEAELQGQTNYLRVCVARPEMTVMVARDQGGGALAVLAAAIDDSVCAIDFAIATCHEARWALHDHLVRILIARRVRYVLSADDGLFGALAYTPNVQHYQHLLGYELRHMIPARRCATRRPRRLAWLAVVAASAALIVPPVANGAEVWKPLVSATRTMSHNTAGLLERELRPMRLFRPTI